MTARYQKAIQALKHTAKDSNHDHDHYEEGIDLIRRLTDKVVMILNPKSARATRSVSTRGFSEAA